MIELSHNKIKARICCMSEIGLLPTNLKALFCLPLVPTAYEVHYHEITNTLDDFRQMHKETLLSGGCIGEICYVLLDTSRQLLVFSKRHKYCIPKKYTLKKCRNIKKQIFNNVSIQF